MFDDFIINLLLLVLILLIIYSVYFMLSVFLATKKHQLGLEQKFVANELPGNLIVLIYAKDGDTEVLSLIETLRNQNYPKQNYQIHVLFDNSYDDCADMLEQTSDVKVWRINKGSPMGKDNALSWILERLISFRNVNAFVFLDANRRVDLNFLSNINSALFYSDVIVPAKQYITSRDNIPAVINNASNKFFNRIFNTARAYLRLINPIDSGAVVIKQEVLEVVKCVEFKDKLSEYKYSVLLASKGFTPVFAPDVKTKTYFNGDDELNLIQKISLLKYSCSKLFTSDFKVAEYLLYLLLRPSSLLIIMTYVLFYTFLYNFEVKNVFLSDITWVSVSAAVTFMLWIIALIVASEEKINPILLIFTPIYQLLGKIFKNSVKKDVSNHNKDVIPKGNCTKVEVTDGKYILNCFIEMKNTGKGMMAVFRYKSKTLSSEVYDSPKKALQDIADKLKQSNLTMRICSTCSHFELKPNAKISSQCGLCSQKDKMTADIKQETTLLDTCGYYESLADLDNVISMKEHLENLTQDSDDCE